MVGPRYTSPYKFYQFWLNVSDEDAARYIKIFTSLSQEEVEALTAEHAEAPHLRVLQKRLAKEVTVMVHSEEDYNAAVEASGILFGNATSEALKSWMKTRCWQCSKVFLSLRCHEMHWPKV